jgi:hypothetical protein
LFKSAREDDVVAEDPAAFVKSAHNRATSPNKRSFAVGKDALASAAAKLPDLA